MEYAKVTGDKQYDPVMLKGLGVASHGKQGSFLESESAPAWNDDILWWAMPSATGALIYGPDATFTDGLSMKQVTINTFNQVWKTWDDKCGGGLYWIRNQRKGAGYKSTITNVQQMLIGAQLTAITGDKSYVQKSDQILKWLKSSGLYVSGKIYDGVNSEENCKLTKVLYSYNPGVILSALSWMYKVTNDKSYIKDMQETLDTTIYHFTNKSIVFDRCEPNCPLNAASYKGAFARGLGFMYELSPDEGQRNTAKNLLTTSVKAMLDVCDDQWNCGNNWASKQKAGKSVHDQMNAIELMTAFYKTFGNSVAVKPIQAATSSSATSISITSSAALAPSTTTLAAALVSSTIASLSSSADPYSTSTSTDSDTSTYLPDFTTSSPPLATGAESVGRNDELAKGTPVLGAPTKEVFSSGNLEQISIQLLLASLIAMIAI